MFGCRLQEDLKIPVGMIRAGRTVSHETLLPHDTPPGMGLRHHLKRFILCDLRHIFELLIAPGTSIA